MPDVFRAGLVLMLVQIQFEGWTFSLDGKGNLTIHTEGTTLRHKHEGMTPDELKGFAQGWAANHNRMTGENNLIPSPPPHFQ